MTVRRINRWLLPVLLLVCVTLVQQLAERYPLRVDISAQRINSLSASAEQALAALPGPVLATAWLPELAVEREQLDQLIAPYLSAPARVQLDVIDPTRFPERARAAGVVRHGELHLVVGQRREVVARPSRATIDAALHRLARRGEQWIVALQGHGEAALDDSPGGLGRFATRVEALGYRVVTLDPRQLDALPDNTALVLIAGPDQAYPQHVTSLIADLLRRGRAVLWLTGTQAVAVPELGVRIDALPGVIVDAAAAQYGLDSPDHAVVSDYPERLAARPEGHSVVKQARALRAELAAEWQPIDHLNSSPRSWNETGDLTGRLTRDAELGERPGPLAVGLLLERRTDSGRGARIAVIGGRGPFGNDQLGHGDNRALAASLIQWLSGNEQLLAPESAADLSIRWSAQTGSVLAIGLMVVLPLAYVLTGMWLRARRRRA